MRRALVFLLALAAAPIAGCPEEVSAPVPDGAVPCTSRDDCNDGRTCGSLKECVAGHCTADETVVLPCP